MGENKTRISDKMKDNPSRSSDDEEEEVEEEEEEGEEKEKEEEGETLTKLMLKVNKEIDNAVKKRQMGKRISDDIIRKNDTYQLIIEVNKKMKELSKDYKIDEKTLRYIENISFIDLKNAHNQKTLNLIRLNEDTFFRGLIKRAIKENLKYLDWKTLAILNLYLLNEIEEMDKYKAIKPKNTKSIEFMIIRLNPKIIDHKHLYKFFIKWFKCPISDCFYHNLPSTNNTNSNVKRLTQQHYNHMRNNNHKMNQNIFEVILWIKKSKYNKIHPRLLKEIFDIKDSTHPQGMLEHYESLFSSDDDDTYELIPVISRLKNDEVAKFCNKEVDDLKVHEGSTHPQVTLKDGESFFSSDDDTDELTTVMSGLKNDDDVNKDVVNAAKESPKKKQVNTPLSTKMTLKPVDMFSRDEATHNKYQDEKLTRRWSTKVILKRLPIDETFFNIVRPNPKSETHQPIVEEISTITLNNTCECNDENEEQFDCFICNKVHKSLDNFQLAYITEDDSTFVCKALNNTDEFNLKVNSKDENKEQLVSQIKNSAPSTSKAYNSNLQTIQSNSKPQRGKTSNDNNHVKNENFEKQVSNSPKNSYFLRKRGGEKSSQKRKINVETRNNKKTIKKAKIEEYYYTCAFCKKDVNDLEAHTNSRHQSEFFKNDDDANNHADNDTYQEDIAFSTNPIITRNEATDNEYQVDAGWFCEICEKEVDDLEDHVNSRHQSESFKNHDDDANNHDDDANNHDDNVTYQEDDNTMDEATDNECQAEDSWIWLL